MDAQGRYDKYRYLEIRVDDGIALILTLGDRRDRVLERRRGDDDRMHVRPRHQLLIISEGGRDARLFARAPQHRPHHHRDGLIQQDSLVPQCWNSA